MDSEFERELREHQARCAPGRVRAVSGRADTQGFADTRGFAYPTFWLVVALLMLVVVLSLLVPRRSGDGPPPPPADTHTFTPEQLREWRGR